MSEMFDLEFQDDKDLNYHQEESEDDEFEVIYLHLSILLLEKLKKLHFKFKFFSYFFILFYFILFFLQLLFEQ